MLGGRAEPELRELRLAQCDQSGAQVGAGEVTIGGGRPRRPCVGAIHGRHAGDVGVVLDEGGHAGEEAAARAGGPGGVEGPVRDTVEDRVDGLGSGYRRVDHLIARHRAAAQRGRQTDRVQVTEGVIAECMNTCHAADGTSTYLAGREKQKTPRHLNDAGFCWGLT